MKVNIEINDDLMAKAKLVSNGLSEKLIVEKALRLFIAIETQKAIKKLYGKVEIDDNAYL
jgi:Arc/MetJ family transcription regulator